jgi:hypothetical protein
VGTNDVAWYGVVSAVQQGCSTASRQGSDEAFQV